MNKKDLIKKIAEGAELTNVQATTALNSTLSAISESLQDGNKIALAGFGIFSIQERAARQGINPSTKQPMQIPAKKVVKFKAGKELADNVNV